MQKDPKIVEKKILNYRVLLVPEADGGFTVKVPAIKWCITYGETIPLAMEMAQDAIEWCLEVLVQQGLQLPEDDSNTLEYMINLPFSFPNGYLSKNSYKVA